MSADNVCLSRRNKSQSWRLVSALLMEGRKGDFQMILCICVTCIYMCIRSIFNLFIFLFYLIIYSFNFLVYLLFYYIFYNEKININQTKDKTIFSKLLSTIFKRILHSVKDNLFENSSSL